MTIASKIEIQLFNRIKRRLAKKGEQLRKSRGQRMLLDLGEYYIVGVEANAIIQKDVDLNFLAREIAAKDLQVMRKM